MSKGLTIVVPAFNEEARLENTVRETHSCATRWIEAFEMIIVNDGSTDRTGNIADSMAKELSPVVKAVHFPANRGVGAAYIEGLKRAQYPFLTLIPGDNAFNRSGIERVFSQVGTSDLMASYRTNPEARTTLRRWLSVLASYLMWRPRTPSRHASALAQREATPRRAANAAIKRRESPALIRVGRMVPAIIASSVSYGG